MLLQSLQERLTSFFFPLLMRLNGSDSGQRQYFSIALGTPPGPHVTYNPLYCTNLLQ